MGRGCCNRGTGRRWRCALVGLVWVCWAPLAVGFEISRAAEGVCYGPRPESPADWRALAERGVRTVLGVDGLPPDLELAVRHGLRVILVPLGYDGVDR